MQAKISKNRGGGQTGRQNNGQEEAKRNKPRRNWEGESYRTHTLGAQHHEKRNIHKAYTGEVKSTL